MNRILIGDVREKLVELDDESVHCVVTSPPYWGLRSYGGEAGMIGLEETLDAHIEALVDVFRQVWRVLKSDGTLWLNVGDVYANDGKWGGTTGGKHSKALHGECVGRTKHKTGLKPKDLMMLPARIALALQADGWWLRSEIIWAKSNPMPESVQDRPTRAHEKIFLMTKNEKYFYDADAVCTPAKASSLEREKRSHENSQTAWGSSNGYHGANPKESRKPQDPWHGGKFKRHGHERHHHEHRTVPPEDQTTTANLRNVWTIPVSSFKGAHFASFPPALVETCIKAGCPAGGLVLDPFGGSGTVGFVADHLNRDSVLIEINPDYAEMARKRIMSNGALFTTCLTEELKYKRLTALSP